jgi:hypothetical protein
LALLSTVHSDQGQGELLTCTPVCPETTSDTARLLISGQRSLQLVMCQHANHQPGVGCRAVGFTALGQMGVNACKTGYASCGRGPYEIKRLAGLVGQESNRRPVVLEPAAVRLASYQQVHQRSPALGSASGSNGAIKHSLSAWTYEWGRCALPLSADHHPRLSRRVGPRGRGKIQAQQHTAEGLNLCPYAWANVFLASGAITDTGQKALRFSRGMSGACILHSMVL